MIIEGLATHPEGQKVKLTPPPAKPPNRPPVPLEFEFLADSGTDDQEDQEVDEAREKDVEDGEPWYAQSRIR